MILTLVTMLVIVGLIAVYSASFALGQLEFGSPYFFVARQAMWAVVGAGLLVFLMRTDYHLLRAISPLLMLAALAGLAAVLAPDLGVNRNGAARWIALGPLPPFQPSEFAKLALIIYVSAWLSSKSRNLRSFAAGLVPFVLMVGLVAGLVMLEPDMGTTIIIVLTTVTLFFVAGGALSHLLALMSIGGVTAAFLVLTGGYRIDRIFAFVSPESDPAGKGLPHPATAHRPRQRRRDRPGHRRQPAEVLLRAGRPHRRHLRDHRRGDGVHRRAGRASCCSRCSSIAASASCSTRPTTSALCSPSA